MGKSGEVNACEECRSKIKKLLKQEARKKKPDAHAYIAELPLDDDEEEMQIIHKLRKRAALSSSDTPANVSAKKGKTVKGHMNSLRSRGSEDEHLLEKAESQTSVNLGCDEEVRARTIQYIARFFYMNGIDFNVVRSKSFKLMVEAIGNYGPHLKAPSYYDMKVPLLKNEMKQVKEMLNSHKEDWSKFGCSIKVEVCTDKENRSLIIFMVNSSSNTTFVKSVDACKYMKTGDKLFMLLDAFVEEIGERNVIQVITDNGSNYVLAGKLLQAKRTNLFWTPCAAHCVDLMLEDIVKIPRVKRTIQRAITFVRLIYNHSFALNMVRKFTNKNELIRCGVTRIATTFLTLQRLHKLRSNLIKMFTSDEWLKSMRSKDTAGRRATNIILLATFWNDVIYSLEAMEPLMHVLRLVRTEKIPAMGYVYQAMDRAKQCLYGNESMYKDIFTIIDKRWDCLHHHPLYVTGYFLNPVCFYGNPQIEYDAKVIKGLYQCIETLIPIDEEFDKVMTELTLYKRAGGIFGSKAAIRDRDFYYPTAWWAMYGSSTPNLQGLAIKVLSLNCCACGYEHDWSIFENIHFKKRSKLEQQRLEDLVFIKYNLALKEHFNVANVDNDDPILLNDIVFSNEWLAGEMDGDGETDKEELSSYDNTLAWGVPANAVVADEPTFTKQQEKLKKNATSMPSSSKTGDTNEEEKVADDVESEEENIHDESINNEESNFKAFLKLYGHNNDESDNDEESLEEPGDDFD